MWKTPGNRWEEHAFYGLLLHNNIQLNSPAPQTALCDSGLKRDGTMLTWPEVTARYAAHWPFV